MAGRQISAKEHCPMSQQITQIKETVFTEAGEYYAALMQNIEQAFSHIIRSVIFNYRISIS
jgi:hypothetical protein